ncbi:hypothetical protein FCM35_KLT05081 [Carex littledalei]|uniref:Uncharacterized protein n=1 Tax=Carex littledalei TaxID=544730 RepID=A0A833QMK1_9POAL|nr:hypothetical protein FCM35_KLT05081 [Carex littledalei]
MDELGQTRSRFLALYDRLKHEMMHDADIEFTDEMRLQVEEIVDYNVPRGEADILLMLFNQILRT